MTREEMYAQIVSILGVQDESENLEILFDWIEAEGLELVLHKAIHIQDRTRR